jgi:ribosome-associated translation inhibitor RaiA
MDAPMPQIATLKFNLADITLVRGLLLKSLNNGGPMRTQSLPSAQVSIPHEIDFPYDISFIDCSPSPAIRFQIEYYLAKLSKISDRITDCKVSVRIPHKHSVVRFFHINVSLDLPGRRIAVSREPEVKEEHTDIQTAISSSFHKLTRQLTTFLNERKFHRPNGSPAPEPKLDSEVETET